MKIRDNQRTAVYRWEDVVKKQFPEVVEPMTLDECKALVQQVWNDYRPDAEPPTVYDGRGRRRASGSRWRIMLPVWARTKLVVLHEIGHSLQKSEPWHSPEFARLCLELWVHYASLPRLRVKMLGTQQKPRRVRFASLAACVRKPKKAWQVWKQAETNLKQELEEHRKSEPPQY